MAAAVDRVGIGWRPRLAAGILSSLDEIDIVEVIADDYLDAAKSKLDSLRVLASQTPIALHGIGLGMASTIPVEDGRLVKFTHLFEYLRPESWSEHLAFVRAGDLEIGHLASPPRNSQSVEGTLRNLSTAAFTMGANPMMENVATLVDPPGSSISESAWLTAVTKQSGCPLLLDLHNVHTNAFNLGYNAAEMIESLPLDTVGSIHIAGGRWLKGRILDDHLHDVPDPVYELLRFVASRASQPLTVILERDGEYPSMAILLEQLRRARHAMALGRMEATAQRDNQAAKVFDLGTQVVSTPEFEGVLARLYIDSEFRTRYLALPGQVLAETGMTDKQSEALAAIDRHGLLLAADSFSFKREKQRPLPPTPLWKRFKPRV